MIERLQENHQNDLEGYIEEIRENQLKLKENEILEQNILNNLDEICEQLDTEITKLYKQIYRGMRSEQIVRIQEPAS